MGENQSECENYLGYYIISHGKSQSQHSRPNCLLERFTAVGPIEIAMVNYDCSKKLLPESKKLPSRTNEGFLSEDID